MFKVISIFVLLLVIRWVVDKLINAYHAYVYKKQTKKLVTMSVPYAAETDGILPTVFYMKEYVFDDSDIKYYNQIEREFNERRKLYSDDNELPFHNNNDELPLHTVYDWIDPDAQNVHDRVIQKKLRQQYENVKGTKSCGGNQLDSINDYINRSSLLQEDKRKCQLVLRKINERNAELTNFGGDREVEILYNTWRSGDDNVKDYLLQQLLDSVDMARTDGSDIEIYCPTGVASRIVNASLVNEPEKMAKTKEVIHQEMMQTAANLRSKLEETEEYKELDEETQSERLRSSIQEKYKEDYITTGILEENEINEMTKEWIEHI